ncbi:MAG: endonuclease NucS domain-containing protein [Candidatus Hodarchaeales archaeon]
MDILPNDLSKLVEILPSHIDKDTILLVGFCDSIFDGRIKSTLEKGERVLMIKKDGSILLHNVTGTRPVQWQKAKAGKIVFKHNVEKNILVMESYRPKTDESFFITFYDIAFAAFFHIREKLPKGGQTFGDEKDFVDQLVLHPDLIEPNLKIIEREKEIAFGFIDLFAQDSDGNYIVIEVKKQAATLTDAYQLHRYIEFFQNKGESVRGLLVANHIPKRVFTYLKTHNLDSQSIPWQEIFPTVKRPSNIIKTKQLDDFLK